MRKIYGIIIGSFALMFAGGAFASFEDNGAGARMRALGGAFVAVADDSESVFVQPAGIVDIMRPEISFTYGRLFLGLSDDSEIGDSVLSAAFPVSDRLALGFGYKSTELKDIYSEQTMLADISFRVFKFIAVGVNLKYLGVKYGSDPYTAIDPVFSGGYGKNAMDADAGVLISPFDWLNIGYGKKNIIGADLGLLDKSPAAPQDYFGISYREKVFMMTGEMQKINGQYRYVAGLEKSFINDILKARFGMGWGDGNYRKISTGIGVNFSEFAIDYSWEYPLSGIEQTTGTHYLTFTAKIGSSPATVKSETPAAAPKQEAALKGAAFLPPLVSQAEVQAVQLNVPVEPAAPPVSVSTEPAVETLNVSTEPAVICLPAPVIENMKKEIRQAGKEGKLPPVQTGLRTYKTKEGDTLVSLADKFYGNRYDWVKIYQFNKDKIEKGALKAGQTLIIP